MEILYAGGATPDTGSGGGSSSGGGATLTVINKSSANVKKGDNVWINESPDYSYNFYSIGSPTFDKNTGVVSGFSTNDYIRLEKPFNPENNTWEIKLKFTTGNDVSSNQKVLHFSKGIGESNHYGIGFCFYQDKFDLFVSSDGTSWLFDLKGNHTPLPNTTYYVILSFDGSKYSLKYSFDNIDYIEDIIYESSSPVYSPLDYLFFGIYSAESLRNSFLGSIDLSETYIKINDELWWAPVITKLPKEYYIVDGKDVTSSSLMGVASEDIAVGTKVANVENGGTEVDGIMSTYVANETKTKSIIVYKDKSFEGVFKVKATDWTSTNQFIAACPTGVLNDRVFYVRSGSGSFWGVAKISGTEQYAKTSFSNTNWIYIKVAYNSNMFAWSYSLDGINYQKLYSYTFNNSFLINTGTSTILFNLMFGCLGTDYPTWNGQIDFNESYFRVDGEIVWSGIKYINGGSGLVKIKTTSEVIEKEVDKEKYGVTAEAFLGDVNSSGTLQNPSGQYNLKFTGVNKIDISVLRHKFRQNPSIVSVDFDTVNYVGQEGLQYAFYECQNLETASFPSLTDVWNRGLHYIFYECNNLKSITFPALVSINGEAGLSYVVNSCDNLTLISMPLLKTVGKKGLEYALGNTKITSLDLPSLETADYYGLANLAGSCKSLVSINLPLLTTVGNYGLSSAFSNCSALTSVSLPSLTTAGNYGLDNIFYQCTSLTTVSLPLLETVGTNALKYAFAFCKALTTISFPSLTSVQTNSFGTGEYYYAFRGCDALTEIHFRSDMQETISACTGYADKWGATNATIYFDL